MGLKSTTCAYHRNDPEYTLDKAQLYTNSFLIKLKKKKKKLSNYPHEIHNTS